MTVTETAQMTAVANPETAEPALVIPPVEGRQLAWAGITTGTAQDGELLTSAELIQRAGLDWGVESRPLFRHLSDGRQVESRSYETYRTDTEDQIGTVKERYVPLTNAEAFAFGDSIAEQGAARWVHAGMQGNGRRLFATMKLAEPFTVLGHEKYDLHLVLMTSHDGSRAITGFATPIRFWCLNQTNAVMSNHLLRFAIQHTTSMHERLEDARETIQRTAEFITEFQVNAEKLAKLPVGDRRAKRLIETIIPAKRGRREEIVQGILATAQTSPTIPDELRGTGYGLLNGLTEYMDHVKESRSGNARFESVFFGEGARAQHKLLAMMADLN